MTIKYRIVSLENRPPIGPDRVRFRAWLTALYEAGPKADEAPAKLTNAELLDRLRGQQDEPQKQNYGA